MLSLHRLTLLALLAAPLARGQGFTTPDGVSVRMGDVDPADTSHIVLDGQLSGTWETFDGGMTWVELALPSPYLGGRSARFDAESRLMLCASAIGSSDVVLRRENGSFLEVGVLPDTPEVFRIEQVQPHPTDVAQRIIEATSEDSNLIRVYATDDDGSTWSTLATYTQGTSVTARVNDIQYGLVDGQERIVYLRHFSANSLESGGVVVVGTDEGWSHFENTVDWTLSQSGSGTRYATRSNFFGALASVHRRDVGRSWTPVGDPGNYNHVVCGNVDPNLVIRGRDSFQSPFIDQLDASYDGGATWSKVAINFAPNEALADLRVGPRDEALYVTIFGSPWRVERILLDTTDQVQECVGVVNSTGTDATLIVTGNGEVTANRLHLLGQHLPAGACFLPITSRDSGLVFQPGGSDGNLCLGGTIGRLLPAIGHASEWGDAPAETDLAALPQVTTTVAAQAGETWRFQLWYRDGSSSNFTGAVAVSLR